MTRSTPLPSAHGRSGLAATPQNARSVLLIALLALAAASPARAAKPGETAATVPAEPQQTMATFGDWVVRCERPAPAAPAPGGASLPAPRRVCEAAQALVIKGQQAPVAQIAFGRLPADGNDASKETGKAAGDAGLTLTVLLPINIAFDKAPHLAGPDDNGGATLNYRRCVPGGCLADAKPTAALLKELRATAKPGHLSFTDAAERTLSLPFSTHGLAQALDDLTRETAKDANKDNG